MADKLALKVILGSTRPGRFSDKPGAWIADLAKQTGDFDVEILDLRGFDLPLFNQSISPSQVKDGAYADESVRTWAAKIREADAFVMVVPEYNHGVSGVLKNALDSVSAEWRDKPAGHVAYGSVGGARAVEHLRGIEVELHMASVRDAVHIFAPWSLLDEKGDLRPGSFDQYVRAAQGMLSQLASWARAFRTVRQK